MSKVVSLCMSFLLVFTSFNLPALAEGVDSPEKNIIAICELDADVANQVVEKNATLDAINLPESLDVTVSYQIQKDIAEEDLLPVAGVCEEVVGELEDLEAEDTEKSDETQPGQPEEGSDGVEPEQPGVAPTETEPESSKEEPATSQTGNDENGQPAPDSQENVQSSEPASTQSESEGATEPSEPSASEPVAKNILSNILSAVAPIQACAAELPEEESTEDEGSDNGSSGSGDSKEAANVNQATKSDEAANANQAVNSGEAANANQAAISGEAENSNGNENLGEAEGLNELEKSPKDNFDESVNALEGTLFEEITEVVSVPVVWSLDEEKSSKDRFEELEPGEEYIFVPEITTSEYGIAANLELPTITVTVAGKKVGFEQSVEIDGVIITVTAEEGVFPEGATLCVRKATKQEEKNVEDAIEDVREDKEYVYLSNTYDISILDKDGNEIEPDTTKGSVWVTFKMAEITNKNFEPKVYHTEQTVQGLSAEYLESVDAAAIGQGSETPKEENDEITVGTDGFSYYTVEFTYNELQYVLPGDEKVALTTILDAVGIEVNGEISEVVGSNDELFKSVKEDDVWYIEALEAFSSKEWLKVTIGGVEYEITVTDDQQVTTWTDLQNALSGTNGTITLGDNINATTGNTTLVVSGTKTLDLNGYIIDGKIDGSSDVGSVIKVSENAKMTLVDSRATNLHTGGYSSFPAGGIITGGYSTVGTWTLDDENKLGGGVYVDKGEFIMSGGTIMKNTGYNGGGLYINEGTFTMNGGAIKENYAASYDGGGVYCNQSNATITGGIISGNSANRNAGGIYCVGKKFNMSGGEVSNNKSNSYAGGVDLNDVEFNMSGESAISENVAVGQGGGVRITGTSKDTSNFTMTGNSKLTRNKSGGYGGGVCVDKGTFIMKDNSTIAYNTTHTTGSAASSGGGVQVAINGAFKMISGSIDHNTAYNEDISKCLGGGVTVLGTITLGGTAKITDNVIGGTVDAGILTGGTKCNVYLMNNKTIKLESPKSGMSIGVTMIPTSTSVVFTTDPADGYIGYFNADDNEHYKVVYDTYKKLMLKSATPSAVVTAPTVVSDWTYDGVNHDLLNSLGEASNGTMNYAIGDSSTTAPTTGWSTSVPTGKNAGTYYVWYKCVGDEDYSDTNPVCLTVVCNQKVVSVSGGITAANRAYVKDNCTVTLITKNAIFDGKVAGDNLSVTATGTMDDDSIGEDKTVRISNMTLTGTSKDNYSLDILDSQLTTTVTITKPVPPQPSPSHHSDSKPTSQGTTPVAPQVVYAENGMVISNYDANNTTGTEPLPFTTGDGTNNGWQLITESLDDYVAQFTNKPVGALSVTMNGAATVDTNLITAAHEKKTPLLFVLDDGVSVGIPRTNNVIGQELKAGQTPYFKISAMTTADVSKSNKPNAGLNPRDIVAIGGNQNTPVVYIQCSNKKLGKNKYITITFDAATIGYKNGENVYLYSGTEAIGISMYKKGKVGRNGLVTFTVPMTSNYWTIGNQNLRNKLLHNLSALVR